MLDVGENTVKSAAIDALIVALRINNQLVYIRDFDGNRVSKWRLNEHLSKSMEVTARKARPKDRLGQGRVKETNA